MPWIIARKSAVVDTDYPFAEVLRPFEHLERARSARS